MSEQTTGVSVVAEVNPDTGKTAVVQQPPSAAQSTPDQTPSPQISTEQAQRMPLAELRKAVTATEAPAPAPSPFDFRVSQTGGMELSFTESGNRFIANSAQELIEKIAQSKAEGDRYIRELKQQMSGQNPQPAQTQPQLDPTQPAPNAEPAMQFTPEQEAEYTQQFIREVMTDPEVSRTLRDQVASELLGVPAEQVPALLMDIRYTTNAAKLERAAMEFRMACPDFAETPENNAAVLSLLPGDRLPTAQDMRRAWAIAKYEGAAKPISTERPEPIKMPTPPPMPSSSGLSTTGEPDPWSQPLSQLKKRVQGA